MSSKRRAAIVVGMIAVALLSCSAPPVHAADKAPPGVAALPGTWTKESARDVLSRLSDEQVRTLLLDQLDKSATSAPPSPGAGAGMSGVAGTMDANAGMARARVGELYDALLALPATTREAIARLTDGASAGIWTLGSYFIVMLVVGWLVERAYDYGLRRYRRGLSNAPAPTFAARAFQLALGLVLDLGGILVFALAALAVFAARWLEGSRSPVSTT